MIAPDCHAVVLRFVRHGGSWPKEFGDIHSEDFCEEENVLVGCHTASRFDVSKNVARNVAPSNLQFRDEHVLRPYPLVAELGHFAPNEICVAIHTQWRSS
jgi:hypothetical protein